MTGPFKLMLRELPSNFPVLTGIDWEAAPVQLVWFRDLILTQHWLTIEQILVEGCAPTVHVVRWNHNYYLLNGHHRVVKQHLRNEVETLASVFTA